MDMNSHPLSWVVCNYLSMPCNNHGGLLSKPPLKLDPQFYVDMISYASRPWWRHQMETFSTSLALGEGMTGGFPSQSQVTRSFSAFFELRWTNGVANNQDPDVETPSRSLWRPCNALSGWFR